MTENGVVKSESGEVRGMRDLLQCLSDDDLKGFLKTLTGSLVTWGNVPLDEDGRPSTDPRTHALNTVLEYSDPFGLLNRQRMKKAYLATYLNKKGVKMTMPATKNSLCKDVLRYWNLEVPYNLRLIEDEELVGRATQSPSTSIGRITMPGGSRGRNSLPAVQNQNLSPTQSQPVQVSQPDSSPSSSSQGASMVVAGSQPGDELMEYESSQSLRQREAELGQQLGKEFSVWFYERLNTLTDFNASHFWPECSLRLEFIFAAQANQAILETSNGGETCCAKLKDLVAVKRLYFNPNTDTGIRGLINPHGMTYVLVCGIIYNKENGTPVGVFEQMFGLLKDPRIDNNYKIKYTILRLREGGHLALQSSQPELCDSSLVGIIEEVD